MMSLITMRTCVLLQLHVLEDFFFGMHSYFLLTMLPLCKYNETYHIYNYFFKSIIADVTGNALLALFSPEAHSLLPACAEVLSYVPDPNPYELPPIIKNLQNTKHRFQVHFGVGSRKGTPRLVLNHVRC